MTAEARRARRRGDLLPQPLAESAIAEDGEIEGVPVRIFTPKPAAGTVLHLHGGGFVYGGARLQDARLEQLAVACGATVISVEYRLAPEHPYPAAPKDCEAVALELIAAGSELALLGESAGANLAVTTLLRLRDRLGHTGVRAAALVSGVYDLELTHFSETADDSLTFAELNGLIGDYAGGAERADPELSPVNADLRGLPPALFAVGSLDPLLHDSLRLADRWRDAGNIAHLELKHGAVHGFDASPYVEAFLREHFLVA
jgi:acetyl esterase/lipase